MALLKFYYGRKRKYPFRYLKWYQKYHSKMLDSVFVNLVKTTTNKDLVIVEIIFSKQFVIFQLLVL